MPCIPQLRAGAVLLLACVARAGDTAKPPAAIKPEPLAVSPGQPLSQRALVLRPPPLKGVVSWTLETRRHRGAVLTAALDKDGKRLATGGTDGFVRLWDAATGRFLRALVGHDGWVFRVDWSPDGKTLASAGGRDDTVRLWDASTGMPLRVLRGNKGHVNHVAWSPDGRSVAAAGGTSGFITLWDVDQPKPARTVEAGSAIAGLAWAPDGKRLAAAGVRMGVRLWDIREGEGIRSLDVPGKAADSVAWSPDGKALVGSGGGKTLVWSPDTGDVLRQWDFGSRALAFAPGGSLAAATGEQVHVWRPGAFDKEAAVVPQSSSVAVAFAPEGTLFVATPTAVVHWRLSGPKEERVLDVAGDDTVLYTPGRPLVSGLGQRAPSVWGTTTGTTTGKRIARLQGHAAAVTAAAWSGDGRLLATGSRDKTVRLWDAGGKPVRTLEGHEGAVTCVAWADGKTLASGSADGTVRLWQADRGGGKVLWKHDGAVLALAWSRGGKQLASGADEAKLRVGSPAEGKVPREVPSEPTRALAWSPSGKLLAAGATTGGVRLINAATGKVQQEWEARGDTPEITRLAWITSLAWSPDGTMVLAGRANYTADVFRVGSPEPVRTLHEMHPPTGVAWAPVGATGLLSGAGRSVRAYDLPAGGMRGTIIVQQEQLVTVSAFGHYRAADEAGAGLVYVVQTTGGQEVYEPRAFAAKFRFKNNPAAVRLSGK